MLIVIFVQHIIICLTLLFIYSFVHPNIDVCIWASFYSCQIRYSRVVQDCMLVEPALFNILYLTKKILVQTTI
jgi:hypothetical protein